MAKAQQKVQNGVKSVLYPWFELILLFQHQDLVLSFIFSFLLIILGGRDQIMVELGVGEGSNPSWGGLRQAEKSRVQSSSV